MTEIQVHLRFLTPCLGHVRQQDCDRFERDTHGNVIFMNSWWRRVLDYGAQALGKHQRDIADVRVHPRIEGETKQFKRYYAPHRYKLHEAFLANASIGVRMLLPDSIPLDDFIVLLRLAGSYRGISPYGWKTGYGHFEVINCERL